MKHPITVIAVFISMITAALVLPRPSYADEGWPRTIVHDAGELVLEHQPVRIVSTAPSVTGILLGIGAPVLASAATAPSVLTDEKGFFTQWADVADERQVEVLYPSLRFDIEAVIGLKPDLVVVSATGADSVLQHIEALRQFGMPTLVVNYSNKSWEEIAIQLGRATGHEAGTAQAIESLNSYAQSQSLKIDAPKDPVSIVGYNIGASYSVGRRESPHARLLEALGFKVAGLPDALRSEVTRSSDFDFISHENLPAAIAGDSVFLLRGTDADVSTFLADPVLANRPAVQNRRVYPLGPSSHRIDYYSGRQMIDAVVRSFSVK